MELKRFFAEYVTPDTLRVDAEEFTHMTKVLRHKVGYRVIVNPSDGTDVYGEIVEMGRDYAIVRADEVRPNDALPQAEITLFQAIPKRDKMDWIVQKCVELGVRRVVPIRTQYVNERDFARDRAIRIADQACKQCGRSLRMQVDAQTEWSDALAMLADYDVVVMPYEHASCGAVGAIEGLRDARKIALIVGCEGGFAPSEVERAEQAGARIVSLGQQILRCETAAVVATALVLYETGALRA